MTDPCDPSLHRGSVLAGWLNQPAGGRLLPLVPGVKRGNWRIHDPDVVDTNEDYLRVRREVLERDGYTCRYCAFRSIPDREANPATYLASGYLELHHRDDDHRNNVPDNLVTACPFCHQVHHAGNAGHRDTAFIIWAPWIDQARLNLLVNLLAVTVGRAGERADAARTLYGELSALRDVFCGIFGDGMDLAANFGSILMRLHKESSRECDLYARRADLFRGARVFPNIYAFEKAAKYWFSVWMDESNWDEMLLA
jgi:intracellular multiplication protein IcmJ